MHKLTYLVVNIFQNDILKNIFFIIFSGLVINFMLHVIKGFSFGISEIFAWGIFYYLVRKEFPEWIKEIRNQNIKVVAAEKVDIRKKIIEDFKTKTKSELKKEYGVK